MDIFRVGWGPHAGTRWPRQRSGAARSWHLDLRMRHSSTPLPQPRNTPTPPLRAQGAQPGGPRLPHARTLSGDPQKTSTSAWSIVGGRPAQQPELTREKRYCASGTTVAGAVVGAQLRGRGLRSQNACPSRSLPRSAGQAPQAPHRSPAASGADLSVLRNAAAEGVLNSCMRRYWAACSGARGPSASANGRTPVRLAEAGRRHAAQEF